MKKLILGALLVGFASVSHALPIANFVIDGNTFNRPFSITNNSTLNENITRVSLDLAGSGVVFDTINGGVPNTSLATPFRPNNADRIATGFVSPNTVADGSTLLDMMFTDFNAGESFRWDIDVDQAAGNVTVNGNELAGTTVSVEFSNGQRVFGELQLIAGNSDASQFVALGTEPVNTVPAPTSLALLGIGSLAFGFAGRRRRKS